jgi:hypothetical protein
MSNETGEMIEGMPFADYLAHKALHSTMLAHRDHSSWRHAQLGLDDSATFAKGRAFHCRTLSPTIYGLCYCPNPPTAGIQNDDGSLSKNPAATKQYKNLVASLKAKNPNVEFLERQDFDDVEKMAASALASSREYLTELTCEASLLWDIDGVACKSRLDGFCAGEKRIVELKSTRCAHPRKFGFDARDFSYGIQMAWQGIAVSRVLGWTPREYIIVAVENVPPFCCTIHRLSLAWVSECEERCLEYAEEYKALPADKEWPGYGTGVNVIDFSTGDES